MAQMKRELKAPLRNFTFLPAADRELARLKAVTGKNMTAVLEDLILGRRQFGEQIERFLDGEMARTGKSRHEIIELAVLLFFTGGTAPADRAAVSGPHLVARTAAGKFPTKRAVNPGAKGNLVGIGSARRFSRRTAARPASRPSAPIKKRQLSIKLA